VKTIKQNKNTINIIYVATTIYYFILSNLPSKVGRAILRNKLATNTKRDSFVRSPSRRIEMLSK